MDGTYYIEEREDWRIPLCRVLSLAVNKFEQHTNQPQSVSLPVQNSDAVFTVISDDATGYLIFPSGIYFFGILRRVLQGS